MNKRAIEKLPDSPADLIANPEDLPYEQLPTARAIKVSRVIRGLPVHVKYVEDRNAKLERVADAARAYFAGESIDPNDYTCIQTQQLVQALAALDADA